MIRTSLIRTAILFSIAIATLSFAQQKNPPKPQVEKTTPAPATETPKTEEPRQEAQQTHREPSQAAAPEASRPAPQGLHFDMTEPAPIITHHQITIGGRTIHYTATVGKLPIRDAVGNRGETPRCPCCYYIFIFGLGKIVERLCVSNRS